MKIQCSVKACKNKRSLSFRLKVSTDCNSLNDCGREFHNTAEAKANDRPPQDLRLYTDIFKRFLDEQSDLEGV